VRFRSEAEGGFRSPGPDLDIVALVAADRHTVVTEVGDRHHDVLQLLFDQGQFLVEILDSLVGVAHFHDEGVGLRRAVSLLPFQHRDFFGDRVAAVFQPFDLGQECQSTLIEVGELLQHIGRLSATRRLLLDQIEIFPYESQFEHGCIFGYG